MGHLRVRGAVAVLLFLSTGLSGCFAAEFLGPTDQTTRLFACAVLSPTAYPLMTIHVEKEEGIQFSVAHPLEVLRGSLINVTGRPGSLVEAEVATGVAPPEGGWHADSFEERAERSDFRADRDTVRLDIIWSASRHQDQTGMLVAPGLVFLSHPAIVELATATGSPLERTAAVVLLHHVGHAMGQVNDGIPMQEDHEGTPKHEPDMASVMHEAWHSLDAPLGAVPAPAYSDAVLDDWDAATDEAGVCA